MLQGIHRHARPIRAQAIVELALVAPLLLGIIVVIVQLALLYLDYLSLASVTRDTTRWISTNPTMTNTDVKTHIEQTLPPNLLYSEFAWGADEPAQQVWLTPDCATKSDCTTKRKIGEQQALQLSYRPDHHLFLRGPLSFGFFNANAPVTLPSYQYTMMISDTALPPEGTQPPTNTPIPFTPTPTPTLAPGAPTYTPTPPPTSTLPTTPTPVPPLVATGVQIRTNEGALFDGSVATFSATGGGPFHATINWIDPSAQTLGTVVSDGSGHFHVTGSHTFVQVGTFGFSVSISDGTNTTTASSTAVVADVTLTATGTTFSATAGHVFAGTVGTFTDANPGALPGDYSDSTVTWGDGTASYVSMTALTAAQGTAFAVVGTHTYALGGTYSVGVSILDVGGSYSATSSIANVSSDAVVVIPVDRISGSEGTSFLGTLATFSGRDSGPFSAAVDWGDGASSPADGRSVTIASDGSGGYIVSGQHLYVESGRYNPVTVRVTHAGDYTKTVTTHAEIAGAALHASAVPISATAGLLFNGLVATYTDDNPMAGPGDTLTIAWGDGTPASTGTVSGGPGSRSVSGSHIYAVTGSNVQAYTTTVTIVDVGDTSISATGTASVAPPALIVAAAAEIDALEGINFTRSVATFQAPQAGADSGAPASDFTAVIQWGDGASSPGTITSTGASTFGVSGTHAYLEENCQWSYQNDARASCGAALQVSVTVSDSHGYSASSVSSAYVDDAPMDALNTAFTVPVGLPFTLALYTDENPNAQLSDILGAEWFLGAPSQTPTGYLSNGYVLNGQSVWGAGGKGTLQRDSNHPGAFLWQSGSFTFTSAGTTNLLLMVLDKGGRLLQQNYSITVVDNSPLTYVSPGTSRILIVATEGEPWSGAVAEFTSTDTSVTAANLIATITWGNGSTSQGTVSGNATNGFVVSGGYTFPVAGQWPISVLVENTSQTWARIANPTATVLDAALHPTPRTFGATATVHFTSIVAGFTDDNPLATPAQFPASTTTINWGDGATTNAGSISPGKNGGFTIAGSHVYLAGGTYPVVVHIVDAYGSTTDANSQAIVGQAPTPTPTPLPTNTPLPTSTPTNTPIPLPTNTATPVPPPTNTPVLLPTNTPLPTPTPTLMPPPTNTTVPTNTPIPGATATSTPILPTPTDTPVPPTPTSTSRPTFTPIAIGTLEGRKS